MAKTRKTKQRTFVLMNVIRYLAENGISTPTQLLLSARHTVKWKIGGFGVPFLGSLLTPEVDLLLSRSRVQMLDDSQQRVMKAMMKMSKIEIGGLKRAYAGE